MATFPSNKDWDELAERELGRRPNSDPVEVAPAYDPSDNTSLFASNLLFEMLCALPGVQN